MKTVDDAAPASSKTTHNDAGAVAKKNVVVYSTPAPIAKPRIDTSAITTPHLPPDTVTPAKGDTSIKTRKEF